MRVFDLRCCRPGGRLRTPHRRIVRQTMRQTQVLRSLGALPGGVGLFAIALLNTVTEFAAWVAVLIVAFEQGGAAESGRSAAIQLIPAAFAAPFIAAAGDRFPRD